MTTSSPQNLTLKYAFLEVVPLKHLESENTYPSQMIIAVTPESSLNDGRPGIQISNVSAIGLKFPVFAKCQSFSVIQCCRFAKICFS